MKTGADPALFLTEKTFVARTDGVLVFLNLRHDRYSCLERRHTAPVSALLGLPAQAPGARAAPYGDDAGDTERLAACVRKVGASREGGSAARGTDAAPCLSMDRADDAGARANRESKGDELADIIDGLIAGGVATRDPGSGKRAALLAQFDELREIPGYLPREGPKVRAGHVAAFFRAYATARLLLKISTLERIAERLQRRRMRAALAPAPVNPPMKPAMKSTMALHRTPAMAPAINRAMNLVTQAQGAQAPAPAEGSATGPAAGAPGAWTAAETGGRDRVNELVEIYKILKPLLVTVKDQCLLNSLCLIEFLACYRIYPDWWFGVRLNEFYAHCWVQSGNVIFDDFIQNTSANEPIMVV